MRRRRLPRVQRLNCAIVLLETRRFLTSLGELFLYLRDTLFVSPNFPSRVFPRLTSECGKDQVVLFPRFLSASYRSVPPSMDLCCEFCVFFRGGQCRDRWSANRARAFGP